VIFAIGLLVISVGAIAAGWGHVKTAGRMRSFATTRGRVVAREVVVMGGLEPEGRWGQGGNFRPKVTYEYTVGGVAYTSDRTSYVLRGLRRSLAERQLAAIPDEVEVHYDPAAPQEAFLETHTPRLGRILIAGGAAGALLALLIIAGS
jgi:hypothetical protein